MGDITFETSDGESLQGDLQLAESPRLAVVVTHPHPLMGGDMHTPVPAGFFKALAGADVTALRFNFRGVGRSTGTHDNGGAEQLDVQAAIEYVAQAAPGVPILLAGWSFGADVSLTVDDDRVVAWFLAAPPLRVVDPIEMTAQFSAAPKVLAIGEHDQYNEPSSARATTSEWSNTSVEVINSADHFFGPQLPVLIDRFTAFVDTLLA